MPCESGLCDVQLQLCHTKQTYDGKAVRDVQGLGVAQEGVEQRYQSDCVSRVLSRNRTDRVDYTFKGDWIRAASIISQYGLDSSTMAVLHWKDQECGRGSICETVVQLDAGSLGDPWRASSLCYLGCS